MEPRETTNEKIRKLAEANPDLADVLKSKFPEAFEDEYLSFENAKGLPYGIESLHKASIGVNVKEWCGLFVNEEIEVIVKPLPENRMPCLLIFVLFI